MAGMPRTNLEALLPRETSRSRTNALHPSWLRLMHYCADLGHGEIEKLKIQDGLPMTAEVTTMKIKFSP